MSSHSCFRKTRTHRAPRGLRWSLVAECGVQPQLGGSSPRLTRGCVRVTHGEVDTLVARAASLGLSANALLTDAIETGSANPCRPRCPFTPVTAPDGLRQRGPLRGDPVLPVSHRQDGPLVDRLAQPTPLGTALGWDWCARSSTTHRDLVLQRVGWQAREGGVRPNQLCGLSCSSSILARASNDGARPMVCTVDGDPETSSFDDMVGRSPFAIAHTDRRGGDGGEETPSRCARARGGSRPRVRERRSRGAATPGARPPQGLHRRPQRPRTNPDVARAAGDHGSCKRPASQRNFVRRPAACGPHENEKFRHCVTVPRCAKAGAPLQAQSPWDVTGRMEREGTSSTCRFRTVLPPRGDDTACAMAFSQCS